MDVICLEDSAFYELIEKVVNRIKSNDSNSTKEWKWIGTDECMKLLGIKSATTLIKIRNNGKIRFTQDSKIILYDRDSIMEYLESNAKDTF